MSNKRQFFLVMVFSLGLGASVVLGVNGPGLFAQDQPVAQIGAGEAGPTATPPTAPAANVPAQASLPPTPTLVPVEVGNQKGEDVEDVLLLYDSAHVSSFDVNFCKLAEYYGLLCKKVALDKTDLADGLLRDARGDYLKLIGVSATALAENRFPLAKEEIAVIQSAIESGGANLLVTDVNARSGAFLADLTQGEVLGASRPQDSHRDWTVSSAAPEITREFTGQVITSTSTSAQGDFALTFGQPASVKTLISSRDDAGTAYPIFARWKKGAGSIFVDAGEPGMSLDEVPLREMYYGAYRFSQILPLMFTLRYALGDEAWHNDRNYANLTIDDAALTQPFNELDYAALLREMKAHNFHTTIAFVPANWQRSRPEVVSLFLANPDRYSLAQYGNNRDGYEFYQYNASEGDPYQGEKLAARPLADQEWDILEGLARMGMHQDFTGIPFDKVMIFPQGISPEPTLVLLKKHDYVATVNAQDVPLDATRPSDWDYGMYPANMDYGNFAALTRRQPGEYWPFRPNVQPFVFDLFIDKAALFYSHASEGELFGTGIDTFDLVADEVNKLSVGVEWRSLGNIIKRLYREKTNDDGSVDVKMYANDLILTNESSGERTYHISKPETLNVPISRLTVNGHEFPYRVQHGLLELDARLPAGASLELLIQYGD